MEKSQETTLVKDKDKNIRCNTSERYNKLNLNSNTHYMKNTTHYSVNKSCFYHTHYVSDSQVFSSVNRNEMKLQTMNDCE